MSDQFSFLLPVVMSLFGMAFLVVARFGGRASAFWGLGYLSAALGFIIPFFIPVLPLPVIAMSANAAFLSAFFFYGHALLVHFRRPTLLRSRFGLAVIAYIAIGYVVLVARSLGLELMIGDTVCATLLLMAVVAVAGSARRPIDRLLFWVVVLVCAENLLRVLAFLLLASPLALRQFAGSDYSFVMQVTATIGAMLMAMTALAVMTVDVVERHRTEADRDALTGLLNRRGFDRAVQRLLGERPQDIAVVLFDIDHFKKINDGYGHAVGDEVIRAVAELAVSQMPADAVLARFGGEEFVILLPDHALGQASEAASRLQAALRQGQWSHVGLDRVVTASFGIDALGRGDYSVYDSIARADSAMYEAKRAGRDSIVSARPVAAGHLRLINSNS